MSHFPTESQNHRMVGVGRDLWGSPSPTPCPSRVTQSRLHRTALRWVLNISREGDSTAPLGSLGQGSVTLRGKKFFLLFRRNFPGFSLCPLPLVLLLGTTGKSLAPSSWHPPCRYLEAFLRSPRSLLFRSKTTLEARALGYMLSALGLCPELFSVTLHRTVLLKGSWRFSLVVQSTLFNLVLKHLFEIYCSFHISHNYVLIVAHQYYTSAYTRLWVIFKMNQLP